MSSIGDASWKAIVTEVSNGMIMRAKLEVASRKRKRLEELMPSDSESDSEAESDATTDGASSSTDPMPVDSESGSEAEPNAATDGASSSTDPMPMDSEPESKKAYDEFHRKWNELKTWRAKNCEKVMKPNARRAAHAALSEEDKKRFLWNDVKAAYEIYVHHMINGKPTTAYIHTFEEAEEWAALAERATPHSLTKKRAAKKAREEKHAEKRSADIKKNGDTSALERRVMLDIVVPNLKRIANERKVPFLLHVMPDGTWADLLVRFGAARCAAGALWLSVQLKTTEKMFERTWSDNGKERLRMGYEFYSMRDYTGALVLCVCEKDGKLWLFNGAALDAHEPKKTTSMRITFNKAKEKILPDPWCGTLPTTWDAVFDALQEGYNAAMSATPTSLVLTGFDEAEAKLGKKNFVEYAGIREWVRCMHDGFQPGEVNFDSARRAHLPTEEMRNDPLRYRLLKNGNLFAYPEDQNTKTDVLLYRICKGYAKEQWQFKTPRGCPYARGWHISLETPNGTDKIGTMTRNNYTYNDNDFYAAVLCKPAEWAVDGVTLIWECSKDWMLAHDLLVTESGKTPQQQFKVFSENEAHNDYRHEDLGQSRDCKWRTAMTMTGITRYSFSSQA